MLHPNDCIGAVCHGLFTWSMVHRKNAVRAYHWTSCRSVGKGTSLMRTRLVKLALGIGLIGLLVTGSAAPGHSARAAAGTVTFVTDIGGLNDNGFNHLGDVGSMKGATQAGWKRNVIETASPSDYEKNLTTAATKSDMVVAVGFSFGDILKKVAAKYPKVKFVIIDWSYSPSLPNVLGNVFKPGEASYLAGILAAGLSKTHTIGFVGGLSVPVIHEFLAGYKAGALSYDPKVKVLAVYTGSFIDQSKGKTAGLQEINGGADVVYSAAGASGLGALTAAAQRHKLAIGVDTDQNYLHKDTVMTSVVKHIEVAIANAIVDAGMGKFKSGTKLWNLANNGVGLASYHSLASRVPATVQAAMDKARAGIISGKIMVPADVK